MNRKEMDANPEPWRCPSCGTAGAGNYCPQCGRRSKVKRITLPDLLHEVFHFFTHLDRGFPFTLKMLMRQPGQMQKDYLDGDRARHQKPFSMFFISATISALIYYWVNRALVQYWNASSEQEAEFFNRYWVIYHTCLFPLYTLITYLCFRKAGYYYGEIAVLQLYTFSVIFLMVSLLQTGRMIDTSLKTRYIELPLVLVYMTITNLNFFSRLRRGWVILLSVINIVLTFGIASLVQDFLMRLLYKQ